MQLPDTFDPTTYTATVHPKINIFDESDFETPDLHREAETEARKQIKQSLAKSKNVARVHSKYDMTSKSYLRKNNVSMEKILMGKELIL